MNFEFISIKFKFFNTRRILPVRSTVYLFLQDKYYFNIIEHGKKNSKSKK